MIRFYNADIISVGSAFSRLYGELWTDGDKIAYIGETPEQLPAFEREIDCRGDILMPSLKNAHTHTAMTFLRSFAEDVPLKRWLFEKVFPYEERLTPEDVYAFDRLAILEYLANGTTAAFDMYFFPESTAQAFIETGMRLVFCGSVNGTAKDIDRLNDQFQKFRNYHERVSYRLGFHAEYTSDESLHREIAKLAQAEKEPVYTHLSETKAETEECKERHGGLTPAQYLDSLGLWEYGGGGFHCVWLSPEDRELFQRRGLWAVTCPCSNAKLASGFIPLREMMELGFDRIGIGTDGAASNNGLDLFREMYVGTMMQKLRTEDATGIPTTTLLRAAVQGSARAMGLPECDDLAVGKQADLIRIDVAAPNLHPMQYFPETLVLSGSSRNVRMTMCAGRILYEDGEYFIGASPVDIINDAEARIERLTR